MKVVLISLLAITSALAQDYPRECPPAAEEDPWHPVHLPHPTDCTKFFKCFNGQGVEHVCPTGLHWNIDRDYCDYPEHANCVRPLPSSLGFL